jgi:sulfur-carrier protein
MSVKVLLPNAFQKHTNGTKEIESKAANLPQLIEEIEASFPALKQHLRDGDGQVRRFINFYVNDEEIRFLGNDKYAFQDGDEVLVIPSIAGGCFAEGETRFAPFLDWQIGSCSPLSEASLKNEIAQHWSNHTDR